jgi:hypothetical protein
VAIVAIAIVWDLTGLARRMTAAGGGARGFVNWDQKNNLG